MRVKGRHQVHKIKVQREAASADVEAAASYLEDLVKLINIGRCTKEQILTVSKTAFVRRRCHLGLS